MNADTLTLSHPLPLPAKPGEEAKMLSAISFRRPRAKDLAAIEKATKNGSIVEIQIAIIAALGDIPTEVAADLDHEDYQAASEIAGRFFPQTT